jgi:photosystem II stability/assembly factor-like uncharacterized protein
MSIPQNFWQQIESPTDNFLRTLYFADSLKGWVGGDSGEIFFTNDGGISWTQQQTNTTSRIMRLFFLDDNIAWALAWADAGSGENTFFGTEILKTRDGGLEWIVEPYREENNFMRGIYFLDTLNGFMGGAPGQFLQTSDGGLHWEPAEIDSGVFSHFPVINFKFYNNLYGFACGGQFDIAGVIWKTINGGESWATISPQYIPADQVWDMHFFDSLNVLAVGGDPDIFGVGFMHSSDAGISWNYFEIGVFGQAQSISFRTQNEGWAVVPLTESFVTTFDYGNNWIEFPAPKNSRVYDIVFTDSLTGFAVGEGGVILKYKYQSPDYINAESELLVNDFTLNQNYPNPFNPSTRIDYSLSKSAEVSINVYNLLGTLVETLVEGYKLSGEYNVVWNANNNPSGIYYLQMNVEGKVLTRKMVLLK